MRSEPGSSCRVMVIGWDGATFDLLDPLLEEGYLPNLSLLIAKGAYGRLNSTIPPISPVAWGSFMTGKGPGKHGVFSFLPRRSGSYERAIADASILRGETWWETLGRHGLRCGVVNVPLTYPPRPFNGYLVPGMLAPEGKREAFFPLELFDELSTQLGGYQVDVDWEALERKEVEEAHFIQAVRAVEEQRIAVCHYLLERYPVDVFMVVFTGVDRLSHYFWHYLDPSHPAHCSTGEWPEEAKRQIIGYFQLLDRAIGDLWQYVHQEGVLLLLSDHGFGPLYTRVYLNRWLEQNGLLQTYRLPVPVPSTLRSRTKRLVKEFLGFDTTPPLGPKLIDWAHTQVWTSAEGEQGLFINLAGREPQGTVQSGTSHKALLDRLTQALYQLRDPRRDRLVVQKVLQASDLYEGDYVEFAPDLMLQLDAGYITTDALTGEQLFEDTRAWRTGGHTQEGIFAAAGGPIYAGRIEGAQIIDWAPTILHLLDCPVPDDMDGRVLVEALAKAFREEHPIRGAPGTTASAATDLTYTSEEEMALMDRLRRLGYIS